MAAIFRIQQGLGNNPVLCGIVACRHAGTATSSVTGVKFPVVQSEETHLRRGTGGRSSFSGKVVTVFGATGLLGRSVCSQLGKCGTQINIAYRGDFHFTRHLKVCGDLGQIHFQHYFLKDEESLYKAIQHSDVVVNLIGRNFETKNFPFEEVHVKGARNIARIARECGVQTLIHLSALNATEKPKPIILKQGSQFLASKWRGEQAVREEFPEAIIFRPADMFGENDSFCDYYGSDWRHTFRIMSLWKKGTDTIKQPVFFSDVGKAVVKAIFDPHLAGKTIQAVGPHRYVLCDLIDWFQKVIQKEYGYFRVDLRHDPLFWMKLLFSELMFTRKRSISWERTEREYVTDVVDPKFLTLDDLGIALTTLESRVFIEMHYFRAHAYSDPVMKEYIRPLDPPKMIKA